MTLVCAELCFTFLWCSAFQTVLDVPRVLQKQPQSSMPTLPKYFPVFSSSWQQQHCQNKLSLVNLPQDLSFHRVPHYETELTMKYSVSNKLTSSDWTNKTWMGFKQHLQHPWYLGRYQDCLLDHSMGQEMHHIEWVWVFLPKTIHELQVQQCKRSPLKN